MLPADNEDNDNAKSRPKSKPKDSKPRARSKQATHTAYGPADRGVGAIVNDEDSEDPASPPTPVSNEGIISMI